jgi:hypothetical protein
MPSSEREVKMMWAGRKGRKKLRGPGPMGCWAIIGASVMVCLPTIIAEVIPNIIIIRLAGSAPAKRRNDST